MAKASVAATVAALLTPTVEELGYRIWDVEFAKEGADWHLTVTIDSDDGISINDCERVHNAIDPILDDADPIDTAYYLNVSSPGIERDLRTDAHILASLGERVEAKLFAAHEGKKEYTGTLTAYEEGVLTLSGDNGDVRLPRTAVSRLRTVYFD